MWILLDVKQLQVKRKATEMKPAKSFCYRWLNNRVQIAQVGENILHYFQEAQEIKPDGNHRNN